MNVLKKTFSMFLVVCMMIGVVPMAALAASTDNTESTVADTVTTAETSETQDLEYDDEYRILHLDCGRKYFTKDWIIALINEMAAAGYTHLELAFGNDGMRFLLDDMSVTANGTTYSDDAVTAAIQAGNKSYYDAGDANELTQAEMDDIIAHAITKGIEIIPLLNTPGHMDVIITAMKTLGFDSPEYSTSNRTVDVADTEAIAFVRAFVYKYMDYFAAKGCKAFNIGADEYANDTGNPKFSELISYGLYDDYINHLNALAEYSVGKGMIPMAFNDGIYYNQNTSNGEINKNIMVCYWSSGWWGYDVASAEYLANMGFKMINTHGDYYFVLTSDGITNPSDKALNFNENTFMASTIDDPSGSMFCIWCDAPGSATETEVAAAARITLRKMAAAMQGTTTYSEEVVSGGFNEDGSVNAAETLTTVPADGNSGIYVSGYGLTGATATEVTNVTVDGAKNVKAWDITPYVGSVSYTEKGTVRLPVPSEWNTALLTGFYVENGVVVTVEGDYVDGYYTFDMLHFSVAGVAEMSYDHLIELTVGGSKTVIIEGVDPTNVTLTPDPSGIAKVTTVAHNVTGSSKLEQVTSLNSLVFGGKYVLKNKRSEKVLGVTTESASAWRTTCLVQSNEPPSISSPYWTITFDGSNYYFRNSDNKYMTIGDNSANLTGTQTALTMYSYDDNTFGIAQNGYYLNDMGQGGVYAGGYAGTIENPGVRDPGAPWYIYQIVETQASNGTEVTFTGTAEGETCVTINNKVYKVVVSYNEEELNIVVGGRKSVTQSATISGEPSYTEEGIVTANVDGNTVTFTAGNAIGTTVVTVGNTKYTVHVIKEDLSTVDALKIEYWITNSALKDSDTGLSYLKIQADQPGIYSEAGVDVSELIPQKLLRENRDIFYWHTRILDVTKTNNSASGTQEQTNHSGDNETTSGSEFTHVRYWNGEWEVLIGTEWVAVNRTVATVSNASGTTTHETNQLVAYFLEKLDIYATINGEKVSEVDINAVDWGFKSGENWGYNVNDDICTVSFQAVYEDGTTNPVNTTISDMKTTTLVYSYWTSGRGIGTLLFTGSEDYQISRVSAETGTAVYTKTNSSVTVDSFNWNNNEETVWSGDASDSVCIHNDTRYPSYEEPNDNLTWNTSAYNNNNAILIRIYVKAIDTKDTLKIVYYDEKFGDTLYTYDINVNSGVLFNNNNFDPEPIEFSGNDDRIDVTGVGIKNSFGVIQYFKTDLTEVPEVKGKYNSELYTYTGSVISGDKKTLYLYYNINTEFLFPNYVVDFGLPITFKLSDLLSDDTNVNKIGTLSAKYGSLTYNGDDNTFTYTPDSILMSYDVLSIPLTINGETNTTNVGVTPATTVHYEESFIKWDGWSGGNSAPTITQSTEKLGSSSNYGYDVAYANTAGASNETYATSSIIGDKGIFEFSGTGVQVFANCTEETGYVAVQVAKSDGTIVKVCMVNTVVAEGTTSATNGQTGDLYGLPIVSLTNLPHDTYTVTITKIMDTAPVNIDGVRVFNTINDTNAGAENIFYADKEDNPEFYQLRDMVLNVIGVCDNTSVDYKTMYEQVYNATADGNAIITDEKVTYGNNETIQDLLDNGPKNEIYLYANQTLTFKVKTNRVMQLGMKAPQDATIADISINNVTVSTSYSINSSVDMFYSLTGKTDIETEYLVEITNKGDKILSITDLKICDDPDAAFVPFTADDISVILGGDPADDSAEAPVVTYADAVLDITVTDIFGRKFGTVSLSANGVQGESYIFTSDEILEAVSSEAQKDYIPVNGSAISDVEVKYGETGEIKVREYLDVLPMFNFKSYFDKWNDRLTQKQNKGHDQRRFR